MIMPSGPARFIDHGCGIGASHLLVNLGERAKAINPSTDKGN